MKKITKVDLNSNLEKHSVWFANETAKLAKSGIIIDITPTSKTCYEVMGFGDNPYIMTNYWLENNWIFCGCWNDCLGGTLEEFEESIEEKYGKKGKEPNKEYYDEYMDAINSFKNLKKYKKVEAVSTPIVVSTPIIEFKNLNEAIDCLKEWQERLFLKDWLIKITLSDEVDSVESTFGYIDYVRTMNLAEITLSTLKATGEKGCQKFCHELTLVHELLHCKYAIMTDNLTCEEEYFNTKQHMLIEQMAKSLIMAKYNLKFEWFKNF